MYTAIVRYRFRPEALQEAVAIWETDVLSQISRQPGFVRVQLYLREEQGEMMAVGTWEAQANAQAFMQTGVFKRLTEAYAGMLREAPEQGPWEMKHFIEAE